MTKPRLFTAVFFAVLVLLLYQIALMFLPFLLPVLWAGILAHMTYPAHVRLTVRLSSRVPTLFFRSLPKGRLPCPLDIPIPAEW